MSSELLPEHQEQLELADLLNSVPDKGVVITGSVVISVADIDLVRLDLSVVLTAMESVARREARAIASEGAAGDSPDGAR